MIRSALRQTHCKAPFRAFTSNASNPILIDLRSDTVTKPCRVMRDAMANATVGDDVFGDDPTVAALEADVVNFLNKPAALFVPSGTMGNLLCIAAQCQLGDEIILGNQNHIFLYEGANASSYLGVGLMPIPTQTDGSIKTDDITSAVREDDPHYPKTRMVALENTHNSTGGRVLTLSQMQQASSVAKSFDLTVHLDGARLGNAAAALNVPLSDLVSTVDSVSLCLSKGLGAPIGSVIAGSEEMIYHARRKRKSLGGGMRQAGIIAAAGRVALSQNLKKLVFDHEKALELATGLASLNGITDLDPSTIDSNIVYFSIRSDVMSNAEFVDRLGKSFGIAMSSGYGRNKKVRAVTHLQVSNEDIQSVIKAARQVLEN